MFSLLICGGSVNVLWGWACFPCSPSDVLPMALSPQILVIPPGVAAVGAMPACAGLLGALIPPQCPSSADPARGWQAQPPQGCSPRALKLWHSWVPVGCPPPRPAAGAFVSHVPPWERGCGFALSGGQLSASECLGRKGCGGQRVRDPPSLRSLSPNSLAPPPANVFSSGPGCGVGCRCVPIIRCGK